MAPKIDPKKAPAAGAAGAQNAAGAGSAAAGSPSAADQLALEERRIADARINFTSALEGESIAEEIARTLVDRSSELFIEVTYDRLAMDYVVMGLWESMVTAVARANVQPDGAPSLLQQQMQQQQRSLSAVVSSTQKSVPTPKSADQSFAATSAAAPLVQQSSATSVASNNTSTSSHTGPTRKTGKTPRAVKINAAAAPPPEDVKSPVAMGSVPSPEDPPIQLNAPPLHTDPSPVTWAADLPPAQIPCDLHTRHNIGLRRRPNTTSDQAPSLSREDRPSSQRRRKRGPPGSDGSQPATNQSFMGALSDAGSRPQSRNSSLNSAMGNTQRPSALTASRRKSRLGVDGFPTPATPAASATAAQLAATPSPLQDVAAAGASEASPTISAEEQMILAEVAATEQRKQIALRTNQVITSALADSKVTEKGFVVDGLAGRVVPLVPAEEMLQSAKKLAEPLRFQVPDHASAQQSPAQLNIASSPSRVGGTGPQPNKPKTTSTLRREENFFIPDLTAVAMVQPVTPVGGVSVKDTDGAPRSTELRMPKNKMTRQEFVNTVKSQNTGGGNTPSEAALEGTAPPPMRLNNPPAGTTAPQTARPTAPGGPTAPKTAEPSLTPRPPAPSDFGGKNAVALPKRNGPVPPSSAPQSVSRRLPMTPATAGSPSRKAQARSVAEKAAANGAKKPAVVTNSSTTKEFLQDDLISS